jgi:hypothetical protein
LERGASCGVSAADGCCATLRKFTIRWPIPFSIDQVHIASAGFNNAVVRPRPQKRKAADSLACASHGQQPGKENPPTSAGRRPRWLRGHPIPLSIHCPPIAKCSQQANPVHPPPIITMWCRCQLCSPRSGSFSYSAAIATSRHTSHLFSSLVMQEHLYSLCTVHDALHSSGRPLWRCRGHSIGPHLPLPSPPPWPHPLMHTQAGPRLPARPCRAPRARNR